MNHVVVITAQQGGIRELGLTTIDPMDQMMRIRPARRLRAAGESAPSVAYMQCSNLRPGEHPLRAANQDRVAIVINHDRGDGRVT